MMPKRMPIKVARRISQEYGCRQVIVLAVEGVNAHVVTYGKTIEDADLAAQGGNAIKRYLGWPETLCHTEPFRVARLKERVRSLEDQLDEMKRAEGKAHEQLKKRGIK